MIKLEESWKTVQGHTSVAVVVISLSSEIHNYIDLYEMCSYELHVWRMSSISVLEPWVMNLFWMTKRKKEKKRSLNHVSFIILFKMKDCILSFYAVMTISQSPLRYLIFKGTHTCFDLYFMDKSSRQKTNCKTYKPPLLYVLYYTATPLDHYHGKLLSAR